MSIPAWCIKRLSKAYGGTPETGIAQGKAVRRICVFCGSKVGARGSYGSCAAELGELLVRERIGLVFGGGSVGLMGVIADAVLENGGEVIGVIPEVLAKKELLHTQVSDMRVVADMHSRKALMVELADAFIALPGGYGTFEELFEVITWAQLGLHRKNIGLFNVDGYFDALVKLIDDAVAEGFVEASHRDLIVVESAAQRLLDRLRDHVPPRVRVWADAERI